jgi:hypothetical protein
VTTLPPLELALLPEHPGRALPRLEPVTTLELALLPEHPVTALPPLELALLPEHPGRHKGTVVLPVPNPLG